MPVSDRSPSAACLTCRAYLRCFSVLAVALVVLSLTGCNLLNVMSVRPDKTDTAKSDVTRAVAGAVESVALPVKHQCRVSQFVFVSDFELKRELPLFRELEEMREHIHKTLQLPACMNLVYVYLFEDSERYERFMKTKYPELPKRRAFFIAQPRAMGGEDLLVYTYWGNGERIQQDLRHELTHALLHSVLKDVPLWLDEGLAEYFELSPAKKSINFDHVKNLRHGAAGAARCDLARLEQLSQVEQMTPAEYREAWAWVHLMLHSNDESRKVLIGYLRDLRSTKTPGSLRLRLTAVYPGPEMALDHHLGMVEQKLRADAGY